MRRTLPLNTFFGGLPARYVKFVQNNVSDFLSVFKMFCRACQRFLQFYHFCHVFPRAFVATAWIVKPRQTTTHEFCCFSHSVQKLPFLICVVFAQGFMENTLLFMGYYDNAATNVGSGSSSFDYNLPVACIFVALVYFLLSLVLLVRRWALVFSLHVVCHVRSACCAEFVFGCHATVSSHDIVFSEHRNLRNTKIKR